ncbi:uncharacterized protein LOC143914955 [Arctopsyche grandis]|uniref:uncharacterized protein LOC143914955 n=1 Tax=Arctopsyche grandis TaxID=121162 RepID=UPI00406D964D
MAFKEFSSDQKLISLVEEYPSLYNKLDINYKDESEKQKSWMEIASRMNMDVTIVRKRWDNLRDRFVRSYRDYTDSISSSGETEKEIKFSFFYQMMWLAQFIRKRKIISYNVTSSSLQNVKSISPSPANANTWCTYFNEDPNKTYQEDEDHNSCENREDRKVDVCSVIMHPSGTSPPKKLIKIEPNESQSDSTESSFIKIFEKTISSDTDQSDFNFMMSIVADMKHIKKKEKMKFKREVLELLEKYVE